MSTQFNTLVAFHTCGSIDWQNGQLCQQCIKDIYPTLTEPEPAVCAKCPELATLQCTDENGTDDFCDCCHELKLAVMAAYNKASWVDGQWVDDNVWTGCGDKNPNEPGLSDPEWVKLTAFYRVQAELQEPVGHACGDDACKDEDCEVNINEL